MTKITRTISETETPQIGNGAVMQANPEIRDYLHHLELEGLSATTIKGRRETLVRVARIVYPRPLLAATDGELYAWRAGLRIAPASVSNYVGHMRLFYAWAATRGLRDDNPAGNLPVPRIPRRLPRPISEDDLMTVVATAPARIRPWLVLAAWCGMRACEIAYLRGENVMVRARPPVVIIDADATKGIVARAVPLCDYAVRVLADSGMPLRGWAFPRLDGAAGPNSPGLVSKLCNDHLHDCGKTDTLHSLRHRCLTMLYRVTHDLRLVQEIAGHRRPETTALYTAVDQPAAVAAVEALPVPGPVRRNPTRAA